MVNRVSIMLGSLFLTAACNESLIYNQVNTTSSINSGDVVYSDAFISVVENEESYIPKSVSVAEYSGSFKMISDNEDISNVMDKIIGNANNIVPKSSYQLAYAIPTPFLNDVKKVDYDLDSIDSLEGNPISIIKTVAIKEYKDEDISLESIRDNKNQPDFFSFSMNGKSSKENALNDFFSTSNSMN